VGDGAALIARRPDGRAAARGRTALIGVATADLYPSTSIGGSIGTTASSGDIAWASAFRYSPGPLLLTLPEPGGRPCPDSQAALAQSEAQLSTDLVALFLSLGGGWE
jgi:outer membrane protein TolC